MPSQPLKLFLYSFRDYDEKKYFDELSRERHFSYSASADFPSLENAHWLEGFDAVSLTPTKVSEQLLEAFHSYGIRYILTRSIGYDHIDLNKTRELGMKVSHVSYPPEAVADYAIMLMMMNLRKMPYLMAQSALQNFSLPNKMGRSICDSTVGIIGTGQIGQTVISHLSAFGCRILAFDPYVNDAIKDKCEYVSLDALLKQSDVISLHAPATEENYHLLDATAFSQMKDGAVVVNTARGTLIDTDALIAALESGKLFGAALDVLEDEVGLYYLDRSNDCIANRQMAVLRSFPNVILTPHTAFYTEQTIRGMAQSTVDCLFDMANETHNPLIIG